MKELVRIDISKLKYQKTTLKAYVFLSETLRMGKGNEFNADSLILPKSQVNIVRQGVNINNEIVPEIIDIPKWLFDRTILGNKRLEAKIRVI